MQMTNQLHGINILSVDDQILVCGNVKTGLSQREVLVYLGGNEHQPRLGENTT